MVMSPGKKRKRKGMERPFNLRTTFRDAAAELITLSPSIKATMSISERRKMLQEAKTLRKLSVNAGITLP